jgi:F-type H+-transporting ATPase subunit b
MLKNKFMHRVVMVLLALTLVFAVVTPVSFAEEAETSEAAEQTNPLTPLGINFGLLAVHTFNFLLVATILTVVLWRPAVNMLDARAAEIQKGLEDAAAAAKARQNAEVDASKVLADAKLEANKVIDEARNRAEELAKTIQSDARAAAEKIKADAQAETITARNAELSGLRERVVDISVAMAGRILGENIDAKKQSDLVSKFFSNIPSEAKNLKGNVEVVSAMPLSDSEQKKAKDSIGADSITFTVDPSILGGVVVRSADKVIDGSVKSGLSNLSGRLG